MKNSVFLLGLLFLVAACGKGDDPTPGNPGGGSDNPSDDPYRQIVTDAYRPYMGGASSVGLSVGIYANGESYFYNLGEIKKGTAIMPDENTVYEIGSVSKIFAALMATSFFEDYEINEDAAIAPYLPDNIPV